MKNRRSVRNFLINQSFQLKYAFWLTASGLVLVSMNGAVFYLYTRENYTTLVDLSPMTDEARLLLQGELRTILHHPNINQYLCFDSNINLHSYPYFSWVSRLYW
jgi:hypothetical protein